MSIFQKLAWVYAGLFIIVTALGYIPGFTNDHGLLFNLFSLQFYDDLLHLASGIWAGIAAWHSTRASINSFKTFGILYGLDGVVGLATERGYLDFGIFLNDPAGLDLWARFAANIPHILLGGVAVYIGFVLSKKH
jgi:hypothetical protein